MFKKGLIAMIMLTLLFTGGCWDKQEINTSAIPTVTSADLGDDNKITVSTQFIKPMPPGDAAAANMNPFVISVSDYSQTMAFRRYSLSLSRLPEWAHVHTFLLGEDLARKDLSLTADIMLRSRVFRPDMNLLVTSQITPREIMSAQIPQVSNLGKGLKDLLIAQESQLGIYVPTTIEEFTYKLLTPGIEPTVPQITVVKQKNQDENTKKPKDRNDKNTNTNKGSLILSGTAVFKGQKMVGSLNEEESRGYRWMSSSATKKGGILRIKSPITGKECIILEILHFSSKVRPHRNENGIKMGIEVNTRLAFYEQDSTGELLTSEMISKMEQNANLAIEKQIAACIHKSQGLSSDILGWGQKIQQYQPTEWDKVSSNWGEMFPSVEWDVQVKTKIERSNLSQKSFSFQ